jgi:hypothetical protein
MQSSFKNTALRLGIIVFCISFARLVSSTCTAPANLGLQSCPGNSYNLHCVTGQQCTLALDASAEGANDGRDYVALSAENTCSFSAEVPTAYATSDRGVTYAIKKQAVSKYYLCWCTVDSSRCSGEPCTTHTATDCSTAGQQAFANWGYSIGTVSFVGKLVC